MSTNEVTGTDMVRVYDGGILGVRVVEGLDTSSVEQLLNNCMQPYQDSMLYSAGADAKFVDKSTRLSQYRALVNEAVFSATAELLASISQVDARFDYTLVQSDVTQIVYKAGGFFKRHADFLSLATNMVEEHTLLVCITPEAIASSTEGGATTVHANGRSVDFDATTLRGHALLFRKDLEHEGQVVRAGEKHILSVNVWAHRKTSGQVCLITFPLENGDTGSGSGALLAAANAKSYAMSADDAAGMLAYKVEWVNRAADEAGSPRQSVITYECLDASYEDFGTVFRILCRMHVTASELVERKATLDYFLPAMKLEDVLVDLSTVPAASSLANLEAALEPGRRVIIRIPPKDLPDLEDIEGVVCGACAADGAGYPVLPDGDGKEAVMLPHTSLEAKFDDLAAAAKKAAEAAAITSGSDHEAGEIDAEVICCESAERTQVLVDLARTLNLPYVRFKMIFVEGVLLARAEADFQMCKVPVTVAWCSFGDYDNIFAYRRLAPDGPHVDHLQRISLRDFASLDHDLFDWDFGLVNETGLAPGRLLLAHHLHSSHMDVDPDDDAHRINLAAGLALRVALPSDGAEAMINRLLFERGAPLILDVPVMYLPGLAPTYVPPKPVWLVTEGITIEDYVRTRDDLVPLGEQLQVLLEASMEAQLAEISVSGAEPLWYLRNRTKRLVVDTGEQPVSWQVRLSGTFKPYEDAEVQRILEAAWNEQGPFCPGHPLRVEIVVRDVKYIVYYKNGIMTQEQAGDATKTRQVQRIGGPTFIVWHVDEASSREAASTTGFQYGPNGEVHMVKRVQNYHIGVPSSPSSPVAPKKSGGAGTGQSSPSTSQLSDGLSEPPSPTAKKPRIDDGEAVATSTSGAHKVDGHEEGQASEEQALPEILKDAKTALFHRDEFGKTCFTLEESLDAQERIGNMHLDDRVKQCLNRKKFVLPQQSRNMSDGFCNESVYGTLNLLSVTGMVRLAPEDEPDDDYASMKREEIMEKYRIESKRREEESKAIAEGFDAWPPPEIRNDKIHTAYAQGSEFAAQLPEGEYDEARGFLWSLNDDNWDVHAGRITTALGMDGERFP